jgi:hypothetical protein
MRLLLTLLGGIVVLAGGWWVSRRVAVRQKPELTVLDRLRRL